MSRRYLALVSLLAVALAGCGGEQSGGPSITGSTRQSESGARRGLTVDMTDGLQFSPQQIAVRVGDTVTWRNTGKIAHTVTTLKSKATDPGNARVPRGAKAWDSGFIGEGESFKHRITKPGTYRYFCIPHEGAKMIGTIVAK